MRIALHDSDETGFPNLALMKISAWHKAQGDDVEWWVPMLEYDRVYSSKVFTFTPENPYLPPDAVKGGTGYGIMNELPPEIDAIFPDYSVYPDCRHAIGFLTRGCIRKCPWCVVPKKREVYARTVHGATSNGQTAGTSCSWTTTSLPANGGGHRLQT